MLDTHQYPLAMMVISLTRTREYVKESSGNDHVTIKHRHYMRLISTLYFHSKHRKAH